MYGAKAENGKHMCWSGHVCPECMRNVPIAFHSQHGAISICATLHPIECTAASSSPIRRLFAFYNHLTTAIVQNLASNLFSSSIIPYAGFLYHLQRSKKAPKLMLFGFYFLLVFVFATIVAGVTGMPLDSLLVHSPVSEYIVQNRQCTLEATLPLYNYKVLTLRFSCARVKRVQFHHACPWIILHASRSS